MRLDFLKEENETSQCRAVIADSWQFRRSRYVLVSCPMVQLSFFSQDEKGERVTGIPHVPCCYAAGLSSSFKDTSSPNGGPIVVTANRKLN